MDGALIGQALGALTGGYQQGRDRLRAQQIQDQELAQNAERLEAERLYRESMLQNAQRTFEAQRAALEEARAAREAAAQQQGAEYEQTVAALVQRGEPLERARIIARRPDLISKYFAPEEQPEPVLTPWQQDGFADQASYLEFLRQKTDATTRTPSGGGAGGGDLRPPARPTDAQEKSYIYAGLMSKGAAEMARMEATGKIRGAAIQAALNAPFGMGNLALNPEEQMYLRAARDFAAGVLRKESGAAIQMNELRETFARYIRGVGDSPELLNAKQSAVMEYAKQLEALATPARLYYDWARQNNGQVPPGGGDPDINDELDLIRANAAGRGR